MKRLLRRAQWTSIARWWNLRRQPWVCWGRNLPWVPWVGAVLNPTCLKKKTNQVEAGWWFQSWILFSISYMGCHPSHWRTPSFFKMGTLHHQPVLEYLTNQVEGESFKIQAIFLGVIRVLGGGKMESSISPYLTTYQVNGCEIRHRALRW